MLKNERRENNVIGKGDKPNSSIFKTDSIRIENYSKLLYQIVSELGFLIPDLGHEDDPLRRKYQPSLKFQDCLNDIVQLLSKIFNDDLDIFDLIRCRIGEWKFMQNHFLPLLIQLINSCPTGGKNVTLLLEIINAINFSDDNEDSIKSAYFDNLIHHNGIHKKYFSHHSVMGALTTLMASIISEFEKQKINLVALKLVTRLLKNILSSPDAEITKGNLIQNLAYGKKENIIKSMSDCKMSDIIFTLASSLGGDIISAFKKGNKDDASVIFADIFSIIAAIFDDIEVPSLILKSRSVIAEDLNSRQSFKKPIRHGRFSGSVCVQLSTGENMVIGNSNMFTSGITGSLDVSLRKSVKLEEKMTIFSPKKRILSKEDREFYKKLSISFLESHFNNLFASLGPNILISFEISYQHRKPLMQIASYFMEFCRYSLRSGLENSDYYKSIYGMINIRFILENIDYLHELISSKHYPSILKLLPFFREILFLIQIFNNSSDSMQKNVSKNLQKRILYNKNVILLIKRVINVSKPLMNYFLPICIESNDILLKLIKKYSESHPYWYVSSLSCTEYFSRENDSESYDSFNNGIESNFNFEALIKFYSSREVVEFYCHALNNCQFGSKEFNCMIARYLYFVIKSEYFKSLMRPSIITQLQKIVALHSSWAQQNQDLVLAANKIIRKFSSLIIADPAFLVLAFFN